MSVTLLSRDEACIIGRGQPADSDFKKNFFDVFGTAGCLLGCEDKKYPKEKSPQIEFRSKRSSRRDRRMTKDDESEAIRTPTQWFDINEITASAVHGCGSCAVLRQLIEILFSTHAHLLSRPI
ncbi:uncharacterized protein F4822DRAFT_77973 [Hypoxylon trugodes]|uniref:uncharacterized protein n=1 Tax=Hypoxylon trugodes TaxID=326681 RepID=UPI002192A78E|nr:uncharacterized protein F4822DRAFT_77973 [Hypoxylon trugodes]KAI1383443.1 hypothetical protein F4822DRAFT_77973 [Hypoxylon trugodes]